MDLRAELERNLALIDEAIDGAAAKDLVGLLRERRITATALGDMAGLEEGNPIDDLAARRARRRADAGMASDTGTDGQ